MGKLKKKGPQDEGGDTWLVSYADLMTLVACFFILLIAFAHFDPVGFSQKSEIVANHFAQKDDRPAKTPLDILAQEISEHPEIEVKHKISLKPGELIMTFSGSTLFGPHEFELSEQSKKTIDTMIDIIRTKDPNYRILVEGHTDNITPPESSPFRSNWSLSGARAASIIERFELYGFDPRKLVAVGMADTKPLLPNEDDMGVPIPENQQMNRRVVVKVLEPVDKSRMVRLGLGVYFEDARK